jgi:hypothetical protein
MFKKIMIIAITTLFANNSLAEELSCNYPIKKSDTAKTIMARFGKDAVLATIILPEGEEEKGIILFPRDNGKKLEILFNDEDEMTIITNVMVRQPKSKWTISGLAIGSRLDKAVTINKAPISMSGFDWDYGGYASNFHKGKLSREQNQCNYGLRFELPENARNFDDIIGDKLISSRNKSVRRNNPVINELSIGFDY